MHLVCVYQIVYVLGLSWIILPGPRYLNVSIITSPRWSGFMMAYSCVALLWISCSLPTLPKNPTACRATAPSNKVLDRYNPEYSGGDCILALAATDIYKQLVKYGKGLMLKSPESWCRGNNMVRESKLWNSVKLLITNDFTTVMYSKTLATLCRTCSSGMFQNLESCVIKPSTNNIEAGSPAVLRHDQSRPNPHLFFLLVMFWTQQVLRKLSRWLIAPAAIWFGKCPANSAKTS